MFGTEIGGVGIYLEFSFPAVIALILLTGGRTGELMVMLMCCALHECGHLALMFILHRRPERISFYGGGIRITPQVGRLGSTYGDIAVLLAGCCVNFLLALGSYLTHGMNFFTVTNLTLGVFNLLPFRYFDGGQVLNILTEGRCMKLIRTVFIILALAYLYITALQGRLSLSLTVTLVFIIAEELLADK